MLKSTDQTCPHSKNCWKGGGSYKCKYNQPFCKKPLFPKNSSDWQKLELPQLARIDNEEENNDGGVAVAEKTIQGELF